MKQFTRKIGTYFPRRMQSRVSAPPPFNPAPYYPAPAPVSVVGENSMSLFGEILAVNPVYYAAVLILEGNALLIVDGLMEVRS